MSELAAPLPVLLLVDPDAEALREIGSALLRRFGADYRVEAYGSGAQALGTLKLLSTRNEEVALLATAIELPDMSGLEFLQRGQILCEDAARVLLVAMDDRGTRIPFTALPQIRQASVLGRIDFYVVKGWTSPEEGLYPQIQEALTKWTRARGRHHEVLRVVGTQQSRESHVLRDALTTNTVPFGFYAIESPLGQDLAERHGIDPARLPAVILHNGTILHQPSLADVAEGLGINTHAPPHVYDLAIIGAGPAGLGAAVYAASEGLRTLVVEARSIGGQAGTSSMIRNYLGFPRGVSGGDLTFRAWEQSLIFGTEFLMTRDVIGLERGDAQISVLLDAAEKVRSRAAIIASGVAYRRLGHPSLERLVGLGVFYGAAGAEAPAMKDREVFVVGGANSAGQAALHLAHFARQVTMVVRALSLQAGMSDYLVRQIEATANIDVIVGAEVVGGGGETFLETILIQKTGSNQREEVHADALFIMIGAEPRTEWLRSVLELDDRGFVMTDRDVATETWPESRMPLQFETSLPGVFAVGDVRHGSVKRVAAAAGEGAVAVGSIHQFLALPA